MSVFVLCYCPYVTCMGILICRKCMKMKLNSGKRIKNVYGCKQIYHDPLAHSVSEARHWSCVVPYACAHQSRPFVVYNSAVIARYTHKKRRAALCVLQPANLNVLTSPRRPAANDVSVQADLLQRTRTCRAHPPHSRPGRRSVRGPPHCRRRVARAETQYHYALRLPPDTGGRRQDPGW